MCIWVSLRNRNGNDGTSLMKSNSTGNIQQILEYLIHWHLKTIYCNCRKMSQAFKSCLEFVDVSDPKTSFPLSEAMSHLDGMILAEKTKFSIMQLGLFGVCSSSFCWNDEQVHACYIARLRRFQALDLPHRTSTGEFEQMANQYYCHWAYLTQWLKSKSEKITWQADEKFFVEYCGSYPCLIKSSSGCYRLHSFT